MGLLLALTSLLLARPLPASAQGTPFACCGEKTNMVYGFCQPNQRGVSTWSDFKSCWAQARRHFANTTVVGPFNMTAAEKYSVFVIVVDAAAGPSLGPPPAEVGEPLTFDADIIPDGAVPELGYLPFQLHISLPPAPPSSPADCPAFDLRDLRIELGLHGQAPRPAKRQYAGFTFNINGGGCSVRGTQTVSNLNFSARGFGNLDVSFLTLRGSAVLSVEPPAKSNVPLSGDALHFTECDVVDSSFRYLGGVTGEAGNTFGLTQNGSRAIRSTFIVEKEPGLHVPDYAYRAGGDGYSFDWYGSFPQEWDPRGWRDLVGPGGFQHLDSVQIELVRDAQLGSINITNATVTSWISPSNPIYGAHGNESTAIPPSIELYNMESARNGKGKGDDQGAAEDGDRKRFGCNVSDSRFQYIWDVDIGDSAVSRSSFHWAGLPDRSGAAELPATWKKQPPVNPSFWVHLDTASPSAGFPWVLADFLACLRPALPPDGGGGGRGGAALPAQVPTVANGSKLVRAHFGHVGDGQAC